jgi:signal peptidase I
VGGASIYRSVVAGQKRRERRSRRIRAAIRLLVLLAVILVACLSLGFYRLAGESMAPGLHTGDVVFVNKASYGLVLPFVNRAVVSWSTPQPGEIVLVAFPRPQGDLVVFKRVAGGPGDRVEVRDGRLVLNGKPARYQPLSRLSVRRWRSEAGARYEAETFADRPHQVVYGVAGGSPALSGMITVPPGRLFLIGDSRDNSHDSRETGPLPRNRILGRYAGTLWPAKEEEKEEETP